MHHDIVLATANARFSHPSFGLRWLWANLGPLKSSAEIMEFIISDAAEKISREIIERQPAIVGLSVYIWNVDLLTKVVERIKEARPETALAIGGPEVSYEYEGSRLFDFADYLICGEGEVAFRELAEAILAGNAPDQKIVKAFPPDLSTLAMPYGAYTDFDLAKRLVYVEASRGCPFRCAFCLSSIENRVREFPVEPFLHEMKDLIRRGAKRFKFVDRTFNLRPDRVETILQFFLDHWQDGMQVHFEIVPDRLDEQTMAAMARFPASGLRLEVGIQTLNQESQQAIDRRQDTELSLQNIRRLIELGTVVHTDLVVGLPHETWQTFAHGFNRVVELRPHELQVGILKRLKGTVLAQRSQALGLEFSHEPPYEVLQTGSMTAGQLNQIKRMARYFESFYNGHNFPRSIEWIWKADLPPFDAFMDFAESLWTETGRTHGLPLVEQARTLFRHLVKKLPQSKELIAKDIETDFRRLPGRKDKLDFLQRA